MILVDTSVWIDHFRKRIPALELLLSDAQVLSHPFVVGEIAMGSLSHRTQTLDALRDLPQASVAEDDEVLAFVETLRLYSRGVGYLDAHLLASVQLTPGSALWTRDHRFNVVATDLGLAAATIL